MSGFKPCTWANVPSDKGDDAVGNLDLHKRAVLSSTLTLRVCFVEEISYIIAIVPSPFSSLPLLVLHTSSFPHICAVANQFAITFVLCKLSDTPKKKSFVLSIPSSYVFHVVHTRFHMLSAVAPQRSKDQGKWEKKGRPSTPTILQQSRNLPNGPVKSGRNDASGRQSSRPPS